MISLKGIKRDEKWIKLTEDDRGIILRGVLDSDIYPNEFLEQEIAPTPENKPQPDENKPQVEEPIVEKEAETEKKTETEEKEEDKEPEKENETAEENVEEQVRPFHTALYWIILGRSTQCSKRWSTRWVAWL